MNISHTLGHSEQTTQVRHLAFGFFDGLHRGHQAVIQAGPEADYSHRSILTLDPHPAALLQSSKKPKLITALPHKLEILRGWNIGTVVVLPFNEERMLQEPEAFLDEIGQAFPNLHSISCGKDWTFGHNRRGRAEMLEKWCDQQKIDLYIPPFVTHEGQEIRSSWIRKVIEAGDLNLAQTLLGRSYGLYGQVIRGRGKGDEIGFPTVNLHTLDECLPPLGVYAGFTRLQNDSLWISAINIGHRPTFRVEKAVSIEAHLIDFRDSHLKNQSLYGQNIEIYPLKWLRPEKRFESVQYLREAITQDLASIRQMRGLLEVDFKAVNTLN